ncbi:SDR family oxidoreductase [Variovorax sp. J22G73]|uniref:SDR family NAD(P)-dependent oxidoreductase n=1 Tax=unclassified Variovorax TaxID=663243 RepID=UPI00257882AB|nr:MULTISPECIES: SDR family oxidoreductase [unclassified Variovorax]MDM0004962.1 SDR family oxidoreductase [Variovorax sp. J22R203]MDM0098378.1 SDR family oxidoreductase [Variovorax sp. J22G73]
MTTSTTTSTTTTTVATDLFQPSARRLGGKVALVTGAGSVGHGWGNGRAIAVRFAQEGAQVFGVDREVERMGETAELIAQAGGIFASGACDVTQAASIEAMVAQCMARFGRIDVLVNNVGGSARGGPVEMTEAVWDAQVDHNLKSVFLTCKHVLPHMLAQGGGAIVNLASTSATRWTGAAQIAYASTKAAVMQFTRVLAVQYAGQGIRVNTVVPGQLHTPMVETRLAGQRAGGDVQALLRQRQARIPLPFMGDGRDTAAAALFLASDEARFVTGTEIVVDGGMSVRCD